MSHRFYQELVKIMTNISRPEEMEKFLHEILTEKERESVGKRWQLIRNLRNHEPQRKIAKKYHISLCKITRGSKLLKDPHSMVNKILEQKLYQ